MRRILASSLLVVFVHFFCSGQDKVLFQPEDRFASKSSLSDPGLAMNYVASQDVVQQLIENCQKDASTKVSLNIEGLVETFLVENSNIMHPDLALAFPNITALKGRSVKSPEKSIRIEIMPKGVFVMISDQLRTYTIQPEHGTNRYLGKVVKGKQSNHCLTSFDDSKSNFSQRSASIFATGEVWRKFRIGISATGEFTQFHGGSVTDALSAIVSTMNRVTGIFESELAITFELIPTNNQLIFTDEQTDPFTSGNASSMLSENQNLMNSVIGASNYDIGHVFSVGGGGLAALRVVCFDGLKAQGVSALGNPIGDKFDVDFVAHEIGHQFGGNHTFNGCFNDGGFSTSFEPGSGSTIMAYAGICGVDNLQENSDPYFHTASFQEIQRFVTQQGGSTCADLISQDNTPPQVDAGLTGVSIPSRTPFILTGSAIDNEGDVLSYCWEQFDLGNAASLLEPTGPLFRSISPSSSPSRMFPSSVFSTADAIGESLPLTARDLNFRLTVRDKKGGVDFATASFNVVSAGSGFRVMAPSASDVWTSGDVQEVTWNTAGTEESPIDATSVDLFFSRDNGASWETLISETSNDGSELIIVPEASGTNMRIIVKGHNQIFFNTSAPFRINRGDGSFKYLFKLFPNPSDGNLEFEIFGNKPTESTFNIYNERGQLVFQSDLINLNTGFNRVSVNASTIASGVYLYHLVGTDLNETGKLLIR